MKIGLFAENYYPYICGINPILRTLLHRLKDEGHEEKVSISKDATLIPPLDEIIIYDGGGVEG